MKHGGIRAFAGRNAISFEDPGGQQLTLVSDEQNKGVAGGKAWKESPVPAEYGIIGLGPVKLTVERPAYTIAALQVLGFKETGRYPALADGQADIIVMQTGEGGSGAEVQIETRTDLPPARLGRGGVHHVAFRVADQDELMMWKRVLDQEGLRNSGYVERYYFGSLYFREPNGILFELATDGPGFDTDEPFETLGESLALPPFLEGRRAAIEADLKPLHTSRT